MSVARLIFRNSSSRRTRAAFRVAIVGGAILASGSAAYPAVADQDGCDGRYTGVGWGTPSGEFEQKAWATNRGCSGTGKLEVKLMEHKTWAPDDEISQGTWTVTAISTYTRSTWGCDPSDGEFYGEQNLWGNGKRQSTHRSMDNCHT